MNNEIKNISLWSSKHSERNGLAKMTFQNNINADYKQKICAVFSATPNDEKVETYAPEISSPVFARFFG
jgi:hypothetical protein